MLITSGATEALTDCMLGLVGPGDEAILIEPNYDSYPADPRGRGRAHSVVFVLKRRISGRRGSIGIGVLLERAMLCHGGLRRWNTRSAASSYSRRSSAIARQILFAALHGAYAVCGEVVCASGFSTAAEHVALISASRHAASAQCASAPPADVPLS